MTGKGHYIVGAIIALATFKIADDMNAIGVVAAIFTLLGCNAPDWLEIRKSGNTLIPHRTITHWLLIWLILLFYSLIQFNPDLILFVEKYNESIYASLTGELNIFVSSALLGFSIGGLLHLLVDLPNPMGIPILTPVHRNSLNLWKSGEMEPLIYVLAAIFVFYIYDLHLMIL